MAAASTVPSMTTCCRSSERRLAAVIPTGVLGALDRPASQPKRVQSWAVAVRLSAQPAARMASASLFISASVELFHPPVDGEHLRLTGEHLPREHPVYLGVAVETGVGQYHQSVVEVGGLAQRREHDTAGGDAGENERVDVGRAEHDVEIAAGERADPAFGDENVAGGRRDIRVDR